MTLLSSEGSEAPTTLKVGDKLTYMAQAAYDDGSTETVAAALSLSDTAIATASGMEVTGVAAGSSTLTGTYEEVASEPLTLTVTEA